MTYAYNLINDLTDDNFTSTLTSQGLFGNRHAIQFIEYKLLRSLALLYYICYVALFGQLTLIGT